VLLELGSKKAGPKYEPELSLELEAKKAGLKYELELELEVARDSRFELLVLRVRGNRQSCPPRTA